MRSLTYVCHSFDDRGGARLRSTALTLVTAIVAVVLILPTIAASQDPELLWTYTASASIQWLDHWEDGFAAGDLNGDGIPDVVLGTMGGEVVTVNGATGIQLWTYRIPNTSEFLNADIVDVDGDGYLDVLAGGRVTSGNVNIMCFEREGSVKWEASGDYREVTDFAYGDINGDGFKDVAASIGTYPWSGGQVVLFDGRDGARIWDVSLGTGIAFAVDAKNVDGDADMEVAVTNYNNKVLLIDGATNRVEWEKTGTWYGRDVIIEDVDNDGQQEIVAGVSQIYCYEADGSLLWTLEQGEDIEAGDVNGDGDKEILITNPWGGITYLIDGATGGELWSRTEAGACDVGDINGDGIDEIVVGTRKYHDPDFTNQYIAAVDDENHTLWQYDLDNEPSAVVVANIDRDTGKEILVAVGTTVLALDIGAGPTECLLGDFNCDGVIDFEDLGIFTFGWINEDLTVDIGPGEDGTSAPDIMPIPDGVINIRDLIVFSHMWDWYYASGPGGATMRAGAAADIPSAPEAGTVMRPVVSEDALQPGQEVRVDVWVDDVEDLIAAHAVLTFDPEDCDVVRVEKGSLLNENGGYVIFMTPVIGEEKGSVAINTSCVDGSPLGVSGSGSIATVVLRTTGKRGVVLSIEDCQLRDVDNRAIPVSARGVAVGLGTGSTAHGPGLVRNYPNPGNPITEIEFEVTKGAHVILNIYNVLGQRVRTLVDERRPAGIHVVAWDARDDDGHTLPTGVYVYGIEVDGVREMKKLLVLK